jgi:hypothetical protein
MSLNELLIDAKKPWCNIICNDIKSGNMTLTNIDANSIVGTDNDKKLVVYSGFDEKKYIKLATDQTVTGKKTFAGGAPIKGVIDGSNASENYIGEYKSVTITNQVVNNGGTRSLGELVLGPGDWDVTIDATCDMDKISYVSGGISTEDGAFPNEIYGVNSCEIAASATDPNRWTAQPFRVPRFRVNTNTGILLYFFITCSGDTGATGTFNGKFFARRMR